MTALIALPKYEAENCVGIAAQQLLKVSA